MTKPVLLLDRHSSGFLTSRSLYILKITDIDNKEIEFMKDYLELPEHNCYGQFYYLSRVPAEFTISAMLGESELVYRFSNA